MQDALPIVIVAVVVVAGLVGLGAVLLSRGPYDRIGRSDLTFDGVDSRVNEGSSRDEEIAQMLTALGRPGAAPPVVRDPALAAEVREAIESPQPAPDRPRQAAAGRRGRGRTAPFRVRTGSLPPMPALRRFDVDELLTRPGTYFNPETEIVLIVDDSAHVDLELIEDEADDEAAEWILLGDDPAIDEHKRDELVEAFETRRARSSAPEDPDEDEEDEEDELEPDPEEY